MTMINRKNCLYSFLFLSILGLFSFKYAAKKPVYPYKNASLPVDQRVADLLNRMTLQEKILQLDMFWGKEVTNMTGHEATSYSEEKAIKTLGTTSAGSVHDFYPCG